MKNHQTLVCVAIQLALGIGLGASALPAFAQATANTANETQSTTDQAQTTSSKKSDQAQSLTPVVVTGSRIRQASLQNQQPVAVMTRQQIAASGLVTVGDILSHLTVQGPLTTNRQSVTGGGLNLGGLSLNMRNLGAQRVLVLVNGKRWVPNLQGAVDLSTIPSSVIQRIVVLKDGASAIYGSDAITGVVNIITRKKFKGAEAKVYYGQMGQGDDVTQHYSFTTGASTDKSSIILNLSYTKQGAMWDRSRRITRYPRGPRHPFKQWSVAGPKGKFYIPGPDGAIGKIYALNALGDDATNRDNYHLYQGDISDQFNPNTVTMFRLPSEHKSIYVQANYRLRSNLTVHGTFMHTARRARVQAAPAAGLQSSRFPGNEGLISADSIYNPTDQAVGFIKRLTGITPIQDLHSHSTHLDMSLAGNFSLGGHYWNWSTGFNLNKIKVDGETYRSLNAAHAAAAIGPSFINAQGVATCGTPANPVEGCIPWNVLGGPIADNKALRNYLLVPLRDDAYTKNRIFNANLTGGLYDIPFGGELALSVGVQHRKLSGRTNPDSAHALTLDGASQRTGGGYQVNAAYYELAIPLLQDLPGAKLLTFDIAGRWSDYSTFGKNFNGKYSFEWKPINDVLLRGTFSQSFRSPTINNLFGGVQHFHVGFLDPCDAKYAPGHYGRKVYQNCVASLKAAGVPNAENFRQIGLAGRPVEGTNPIGNFVADFGADPTLQPEKAITHTYGIVYSPHQVPGLNLTLDWYQINLTDTIVIVSPSQTVAFCYEGASAFCDNFHRNANGQVDALHYGLANTGSEITEGYDFEFLYRLPFKKYGTFTIRSASSYLVRQDIHRENSPVQPLVGWYSDWRLRSNASLHWQYHDVGVTWTVRYFSSLREPCPNTTECTRPNFSSPSTGAQPVRRLGAVAFNDLSVDWKTPWKGEIRFGVNNIFGRKATIAYSGLNNSGSPAYNAAYDIDRFFFLSYDQKF